jgi:hypothetical protein
MLNKLFQTGPTFHTQCSTKLISVEPKYQAGGPSANMCHLFQRHLSQVSLEVFAAFT